MAKTLYLILREDEGTWRVSRLPWRTCGNYASRDEAFHSAVELAREDCRKGEIVDIQGLSEHGETEIVCTLGPDGLIGPAPGDLLQLVAQAWQGSMLQRRERLRFARRA